MQNWYSDRYSSVSIQRNFLLFFSLFTSIALLTCIVIIKGLQSGKASVPYILEYDKLSGQTTIVEAQTKKEYTAQQAVKESMLAQYIYHREAPKLTTIEEDMNYIRVTTLGGIYNQYTAKVAEDLQTLRRAGEVASFDIKIDSLTYLANNRVSVAITKKTIGDGRTINVRKFRITIVFTFVEMELPIEDMRINPLGFQVTAYKSQEQKILKSETVPDGTIEGQEVIETKER